MHRCLVCHVQTGTRSAFPISIRKNVVLYMFWYSFLLPVLTFLSTHIVLVLTLSGTPAACCETKRIHRASAKKTNKIPTGIVDRATASLHRPLTPTHSARVQACVCHVTKKKKKMCLLPWQQQQQQLKHLNPTQPS